MPTIRQKKLAKVIIENSQVDKPLNSGKMLEKVGYSKHLAKQPGRVLETEGVQQALEDYGFTEDNAKRVVSSILLDDKVDPNPRLKAADILFKVKGTYAPDKSINLNLSAHATDPRLQKINEEYNQKVFEALKNND